MRTPSHRLAAGLSLSLITLAIPAHAQYAVEGASAASGLGSAVAIAGDLDDDGVADLILGAPDSEVGGADAGELRIVSGADGSLLFSVVGSGPSDDVGAAVSGLGDTNGDGVPDLLVGAPQQHNEDLGSIGTHRFGYVQILSGVDGTPLRLHQGEPIVYHHGQGFGGSVAGAGDLDGDGVGDLIVGEPFSDLEGFIWAGPGRVHVLSGSDGQVIHELVGTIDLPAEELGRDVAAAGDIDGDGVGDILIGAPLSKPGSGSGAPGAVLVASGATGSLLWIAYGVGTYDKLGGHVASAGDVDGDDVADVLASYRYGVRLYSGADGAFIRVIGTSDLTEEGGADVVSVGDVNDDGFDDFAIGDPVASALPAGGAGLVRVVSGKEGLQLATLAGTAVGDRFGASLALLPDLDGAGPALVIGAPGHDGPAGVDAGRVHVVPIDAMTQIPHVLTTAAPQAQTGFGLAVAIPGDVNNDGWDDVAVGLPYDSTASELAGAVRVYSGRDASVLLELQGSIPFGRFGFALGRLGDVDGDGFDDVLVGAPFKVSPLGPGRVSVHSGRTGALLQSWVGLSNNDQFGAAVSGTGDIDDDGVPDVLIGAPNDDGGGGNFGAVRMYSGATGAPLGQAFGNESSAEFGTAVAPVGDVDADSVPDFAVGARSDDGPAGASAGRAVIVSGATGAILLQVAGASGFSLLGSGVAGVGDLSGDGVPDLAVGEPGSDAGGTNSGRVLVVSGADGSIVLELPGQAGFGIGRAVATLGDVDGDGLAEFVTTGASATGVVQAFDGASGDSVFFTAGSPGDIIGASLAGAGDVDNDGSLDFVFGSTDASSFGGPDGAAIVVNVVSQFTPWSNAGHKLPGIKGPPRLEGSGPLLPATLVKLALTDAKPGASSTLIVGFSALLAPFKGGTLVPFPNVLLPFPLPPSGTLTLSAPWPGGLPSGLGLWFQYWIQDAAGLAGFAASNAVKATLP